MGSQPYDLETALTRRGLASAGGFVPRRDDALDPSIKSVLLLSPSRDFWPIFTASYEYQGKLEEPLDRWSRRVITSLAKIFDAEPYFPFGPPGWGAPFYSWAQRGGRAIASPVGVLVDGDMGLNLSYRGALGLRTALDFDQVKPPCVTCTRPCEDACPAGALTTEGYDVPTCRAYLIANPTSPCRQQGCQVRLACPATRAQPLDQITFHMDAFIG